MKLVLALCLAPAAALVAPVAPAAATTKMSETKADLEALQNSMPGPPGYWDPLDLAGSTILAQYGVDTVEANKLPVRSSFSLAWPSFEDGDGASSLLCMDT